MDTNGEGTAHEVKGSQTGRDKVGEEAGRMETGEVDGHKDWEQAKDCAVEDDSVEQNVGMGKQPVVVGMSGQVHKGDQMGEQAVAQHLDVEEHTVRKAGMDTSHTMQMEQWSLELALGALLE